MSEDLNDNVEYTRTYPVPADLPDRIEERMTCARASLDNIKLMATWEVLKEDAEVAQWLLNACEQVDAELSSIKLVTTEMWGEDE